MTAGMDERQQEIQRRVVLNAAGITGIQTPKCRHEWHRAPERDQVYGAMPTRAARLVFWCSKCLAVETRLVTFALGEGVLDRADPKSDSPVREGQEQE